MAPETLGVFRLRTSPSQSEPLFIAVGVEGGVLTVIFTLSVLEHPVAVIVSVSL